MFRLYYTQSYYGSTRANSEATENFEINFFSEKKAILKFSGLSIIVPLLLKFSFTRLECAKFPKVLQQALCAFVKFRKTK